MRDLRISVTDRCNFRCRYCMPREVFGPDFEFLSRDDILSFEEIARLARIFASLGVQKFRLTGGEPLLRSELPKLVAMLAEDRGRRHRAHHQRLLAGLEGAGVSGRGAAPRHR